MPELTTTHWIIVAVVAAIIFYMGTRIGYFRGWRDCNRQALKDQMGNLWQQQFNSMMEGIRNARRS